MVLCQGKKTKQQVDRNPAAIKINKRVEERNVEQMLSMLARCRVSRIILFPMLFVVVRIESCMYTQDVGLLLTTVSVG